MRIAMFGHKKLPSRSGGIEVVVEQICTRLVSEGHEVTCYNRSDGGLFYNKFKKSSFRYKGINIKNVFTINRKGLSAFSSSFFAALSSALGNFDVVHIHAEGPALFCWIPKLFGKRVVVTIHGLDWARQKWRGSVGERVIKLGEKCAVKYSDEIIVLSEDVRKYFLKKYGRETHFIPNGVEIPKLYESDLIKKKYGLQRDSYILYLGRLVPEKGLEYLIKAFQKVNTNKKLIIAGGSSDTDDFTEKIMNLASDDERIIFTGFVQGRILEELFSNAYFYVLPSDLEGMPLSLLEAMSYGNCCLVSDIGECTSVVGDKGIVFKKGNIYELYKKMQFLCDSRSTVEYFKNNSSDYIIDKYNWNNVVNETLKLYTRSTNVS